MSRSPFRRYANATLFIEVASDRTKTDEETGNEIPVSDRLSFRALLEQDTEAKDDTNTTYLAGANVSEIYFTGYLVEPMEFPNRVSLPLECDAEVDGVAGRVRIPFMARSPFGEERKTGRKIQAYFRKASG
ncbi:MAG: hypothetical protein AB1861_08365 [Cyanobacteriota bacterium]